MSTDNNWANAPLPTQSNLKIAKALVKRGVYPSLKQAYLQLSDEELQFRKEKIELYDNNADSSSGWTTAPLPKW